uniref:Uncharacterized protein n=1 Tax=Anguilla anguilla TaxID=7936 RepID=A0A0E9R9P2_ANGAN
MGSKKPRIQWKEGSGRLSSTESEGCRWTLSSLKGCTSGYHGSSIPSFMTSGPNPGRSPPSLEAKICRW